jgi:hypothetical protein
LGLSLRIGKLGDLCGELIGISLVVFAFLDRGFASIEELPEFAIEDPKVGLDLVLTSDDGCDVAAVECYAFRITSGIGLIAERWWRCLGGFGRTRIRRAVSPGVSVPVEVVCENLALVVE